MEEPEFALKALLILTNAGLGFALVGWIVTKQLKLRNGTGESAAASESSLSVLTQVSLALQGMENRLVDRQDRNHDELRLYMQAQERSAAERHAVMLNEVKRRRA